MIRPAHAAAAVMVVGLATVVVATVSRVDPARGIGQIAAPVTAATTVPPPSTRQTPTTVTAGPATTTVLPSEVLEVMAGGLAAWGRFAVSGDMSVLTRWFHPEGPQHQVLAEEAKELAASPLGPPPYSVSMIDSQVTQESARRATVQGRVVFVRTGEPSQSFSWRVELRRADRAWQIWTVEEIPSR